MPRAGSRGRRRLVAAAALVAGLSLAALALPRAVAGFLMLPGEADVVRIHDLDPIGEAALARMAATRENALGWVSDGRLWTELALARLMSVERRSIVRSDADLGPVRRALMRGLAVSPVNPYAWSRLAYVEYATAGAGAAVAATLPAAILTGPSERRLYLLRAELGMRLYPRLAPEDRPLVLRQIDLAWRRDPFRTLGAAHGAGRVDLLRRALDGAPGQTAILETLLTKGY